MIDTPRTGSPVDVALNLQAIPPSVTLPSPVFANWADAVTYARGMFARTHYLEAQIPMLQDRISQAQIDLSSAQAELTGLLEAARALLVQGKLLA